MNEVDFVCPRCKEANRSGAKPRIELHQNQRTAECSNCSYSGLVSDFQPKENRPDDSR